MTHVFLVPNWFFYYGIACELIFALVTLIGGIFSFKLYKLCNYYSIKVFSISFLFFSLSYIVQTLINLEILSNISEASFSLTQWNNITSLSIISFYIYISLFILGLVTLTYMTLKERNIKHYALLLVLAFAGVLLSLNKIFAFRLISAILFFFILLHFFKNYAVRKSVNSLLVMVAFFLLMMASSVYIFALQYSTAYVIGHILEFSAYLLIAINFIMLVKNAKKARQTSCNI